MEKFVQDFNFDPETCIGLNITDKPDERLTKLGFYTHQFEYKTPNQTNLTSFADELFTYISSKPITDQTRVFIVLSGLRFLPLYVIPIVYGLLKRFPYYLYIQYDRLSEDDKFYQLDLQYLYNYSDQLVNNLDN